MTDLKTLEDYQDALVQCVRCGACQAHCPVYQETGREGSVARGKIVLAAAVLAGAVKLDERLREEISLCLLCASCVVKCPNTVPTDAIVSALRRRIAAEQGLSPLAKGVAALTSSPRRLKNLTKGASLLSPLLFQTIPASSGLHLRFTSFAPDSIKARSLPTLSGRTLFDRIPQILPGEPGQETVGIFAGCGLSYLYPRVGELLARLPHSLGFSVFTPRDQGCCGMPACSSGNSALLETLNQLNAGAFAGQKINRILTACASCHGMLHRHPATANSPLAPPVDTEPVDIVDIHVFLCQQGLTARLLALPRWQNRMRVTYHDPCHLRAADIHREPRELLQALPQVDYVAMEDADRCCGLGGTFTVAHPPLSKAIGDRKLTAIRASGASLVASSCPGCILQLQDIVNRAGLPVKVVHTLELIHQGLNETPQ